MPIKKKKKVLITCGPTWVPVDDIRVISNISSGVLGQSLARAFARSNYKVTLLEGPVLKPLVSKYIRIKKYLFYDELAALFKEELRKGFDIIIHAAAVSDYRLKNAAKKKLPSSMRAMNLTLVPTAKLIDKIKKASPGSFLVGFKLESNNNIKALAESSKKLFRNAGCDLVVANSLKPHYKGYIISDDRRILSRAGSRLELTKNLLKIIKEKT